MKRRKLQLVVRPRKALKIDKGRAFKIDLDVQDDDRKVLLVVLKSDDATATSIAKLGKSLRKAVGPARKVVVVAIDSVDELDVYELGD